MGELALMNGELSGLEALEFKVEQTLALCIGTHLEETTKRVSRSHLVSLSKGHLFAYSWRSSSHSFQEETKSVPVARILSEGLS